MEAGSRLGRLRISESECRRQQLEAYLTRKGKLKIPGPNARYYLEDKTNRKIQPPTAPSKVGLGGDLKGGGPTKPPKLKGANNPASTNHVKSVAARSRAQPNTKTTEAKKTLSKAVCTVPQMTADIQIKKVPTLFPLESNTTENESLARQTAQSGQYGGDLKPVSSTSACADNLLHKSGDEEKENKYIVGTALNAGHSVSSALIKQFTEQTIKTQVGRSKDSGSDNWLSAIGIGRTAKAATRAAKPAGTAKAATRAAQPAGTAKAATRAAQPAGTAKAATRAAQPAGTAKAATRAAQPAGTAKAATRAAQPAGTAKAATRAAQPAGTAKAATRAAQPAGTAKAATRAAQPAGTAKAATRAAQPAGTAKAATRAAQPAGTAKAATRAAQPAGTAKAATRAAQPAGTAKAATRAAQPAGTAKAATRAAQPAGTAKAASSAAQPAGTAEAASSAAQPAGTAEAASSAAQPAGTAEAASSAAQPAGTAEAASSAAQPAGTAKAASSAAQPAGTAKAASSAAQPAGTAKAASSAAQPAGTAKAASSAGTAKAASSAAKPAGRVMVPKQSTMDKNYGDRRLSKSTQQLAIDKSKPSAGAGLPPQSASIWNGTNPTGKGPIKIWKPFTRPDGRSMHSDLGSPARNITESKGAVQSTSKSTASTMSTTKRWGDPSSVTKTLKGKDERRKQLEEWLTSKGKTYKRPPMPTPLKKAVKSIKKNLELSFWEAIEEEEQKSQADQANHMLDDCMKLLEKGLPPEQVAAALQKVPESDKIAKYWICQARLLELTGTVEAVIAMFQQAVHSGAEPVEDLRSALVEIIMRNASSRTTSAEKEDNETEDFRESSIVTPHTTAMRILCGKAGGRGSSVVKYRVTKTPQVHKGKETLGRTRSVGQQGLKFLTPVRRSVRIEHVSASYPEMLREHDCCVTSLNELLAVEEAGTFVYSENQALLGE
ncbi:cytoskeleton-associated protein 2-like [Heptranchias perlo]|uniref:cytoskeleton-associated protein 2-like n=1 Tax=Heptranchias perlo TaxID=212740 RepID=UPI00355A418B